VTFTDMSKNGDVTVASAMSYISSTHCEVSKITRPGFMGTNGTGREKDGQSDRTAPLDIPPNIGLYNNFSQLTYETY